MLSFVGYAVVVRSFLFCKRCSNSYNCFVVLSAAWFYLRHVQVSPSSGLRGDSSDQFSFASFFPERIASLLARLTRDELTSLLPVVSTTTTTTTMATRSIVAAVVAPLPMASGGSIVPSATTLTTTTTATAVSDVGDVERRR